jgi:type I restriction enzyme R subunit
VLVKRLVAEARGDASRKVLATEKPFLVEENRRIHKLMVEGVDVEFYSEDGTIRGDKVRLIDFEDLASNDWLATGQFTVIEGTNNRRPDIVVFVNGLPLGVIELKNPGGENATLAGAHNQLQTYKSQIPSLFRTNAVLVTSDGLTARIGSLTADRERFMPWRTTDGKVIAAKGQPELGTARCRENRSGVRAAGRSQGRSHLAHARFGEKPANGVLRRPASAPGRTRKPHHCCHHRSQRP